MSLAYSASPWISDNSNGQTQKRVPTMRKALKKLQPQSAPIKPEFMARPVQDMELTQLDQPDNQENFDFTVPASQMPTITPSAFQSTEHAYKSTAGGPSAMMTAALQDQEERQQKIQEIIQKMGAVQVDNDGGGLAEFKPLDHPLVDPPKMPPQVQHLFRPTPQTNQPVQPSYSMPTGSPPLGGGGVDRTTAYHSAYEVPAQVASWSRGASGAPSAAGGAATTADNRLLDKINYMIHLLEQQQNEKTGHATEEFVMFSLVGVFIIFVLDSFSRSGKYTR